jgi:single-strand DNA-binding protein
MNSQLIEMFLIGQVASEPKSKVINGQPVLNWNMAYNNKWENPDGEMVERVIWVSCSLWNRPEVADYLQKGSLVFVQGEPDAHIFTDKEGNQKGQLKLKVKRIRQVLSAEIFHSLDA